MKLNMRISFMVVGLALLLSASVPIIIGSNELLAVNDCQSTSHGNCFVITGTNSAGECNSYGCAISPFYGVGTIEGIRSLAYSLIEIGALLAIVGGVIAVIGLRRRPGPKTPA
jgi:hypothetical protein